MTDSNSVAVPPTAGGPRDDSVITDTEALRRLFEGGEWDAAEALAADPEACKRVLMLLADLVIFVARPPWTQAYSVEYWLGLGRNVGLLSDQHLERP